MSSRAEQAAAGPRAPRARPGGRSRNENFFAAGNAGGIDGDAGAGAGGGVKGTQQRFKAARSSGVLDLSELAEPLASVSRAFMVHDFGNGLEDGEDWWATVALHEIRLSNNAIAAVEDGAFAEVADSVQVMMLDGNRLPALPAALAPLEGLCKLIISHNDLARLPALQFPAMTVLAAAHNKIAQAPGAGDLAGLPQLRVLDLSHNGLQGEWSARVPATLERLDLSHNKLSALAPSALADARNLKTLEAARNQLLGFPRLDALSRLTVLDLRYNRLSEASALPLGSPLGQVLLGFNSLTDLSALRLANAADSLTALDVAENKLASLPEAALLRCAKLRSLDASNNAVAALPHGLGYHAALQAVNLVGNPLRGVRFELLQSGGEKLKAYMRTRGPAPEGLLAAQAAQAGEGGARQMGPLQTLLWSNDALRDALAAARRSRALRLDGLLRAPCDAGLALPLLLAAATATATATAEGEGGACASGAQQQQQQQQQRRQQQRGQQEQELVQLNELDVSNNGLAHVPTCLSGLGAAAAGVVAADAGPARAAAARLVALDLSHNALAAVSAVELLAMPRLERLVLTRNRLASFLADAFPAPGPAAARPAPPLAFRFQHSALRVLDLGQNSLACLPAQLLSGFPSLEELVLSYNRLAALPDLGCLSRLRSLDAADNALVRFPAEILGLRAMEHVNLENNAIASVPAEVAVALPRLKGFLISGNPQRQVPPHVISRGSAHLLEYLRHKHGPVAPAAPAPAPVPVPVPVPVAADPSYAGAHTVGATEGATEGVPVDVRYGGAPLGESAGVGVGRAVVVTAAQARPEIQTKPAGGDGRSAEELASAIEALQDRIENDFSLSNAAKSGLKRQLARERAARIRVMRQHM